MKSNSDRFLTAIFCDDIRQEMGNKLSFMGCYQGELFVPTAPALLSKLCVYASAWTPKERPFETLAFRIVQDDVNELARLEVPAEALGEVARMQDAGATRQTVSTAITFAPFFIEKPTSLRLLALTEEGEIVGPRLQVRVTAPSSSPAVTAEEPKPAPYGQVKRKPARRKSAP